MVKIYFLAAFFFLAAVTVTAAPYDDDEGNDDETIIPDKCDSKESKPSWDVLQLNGLLNLDSTGCSVSCLKMGKPGGRCENGICICRKSVLKDLLGKGLNLG
ncbi:defensin-1-like [Ptiloglossa arizonensis]|uniref:defensin-1-like n=1 Tax=Ptiloglossa arizonensis TaxID=3350558 RepID=UPI003F9F1028